MEFDLKNLQLTELRDLAKANGVKGIAKYRKNELIEVLEKLLEKGDQMEEKPEAQVPDQDPEEISRDVPKIESHTVQLAPTQSENPAESKAKVQPSSVNIVPPPSSNTPANDTEQAPGETIKPAPQSGSGDEPKKVPVKFVDRNGMELREKLSGRSDGDGRRSQDSVQRDHRFEPNQDHSRDRADQEERVFPPDTIDALGVLEIMDQNSFGFLRGDNYLTTSDDIYVSPTQIRRFRLKTGDQVAGKTRPTREGEKFKALFFVDRVNGDPPGVAMSRRDFETLTPIYPNERLHLEVPQKNDMSTRIMDILSPVGKGQRGMIVAPPKAGKTTILKKIAQHLRINYPELVIIVLLIDERPEEVTDMRESIDGEVIYSTFDEDPMNHTKVSEMVLQRAKRLVEHKKDVVILLDSLTRLSRAYNLTVSPSGRTLSGGLDPAALLMPKKFFGAARNIRNGGSLTILATALVETGSRMDDMIFEEFKGTGNMEVHLDRKLQERRIFPAIDIYKSGTRKEELILSPDEIEATRKIRRLLYRGADISKITEELISLMDNTENNEEFVEAIKKLQFSVR
ncbi:MAG: transcription termination factor Rho [Clostridiaceae bacterium]